MYTITKSKAGLNNKGFTLVELVLVIVLLGILSAVAIPKFTDIISSSKEETTKNEMLIIKEAIAGEYGYQVDCQQVLPSAGGGFVNIDALIDQTVSGVTVYNIASGIGWNGPYISINDAADVEWKTDAWGNQYTVTAPSGATRGVINSFGENGIQGDSDDINVEYEF